MKRNAAGRTIGRIRKFTTDARRRDGWGKAHPTAPPHPLLRLEYAASAAAFAYFLAAVFSFVSSFFSVLADSCTLAITLPVTASTFTSSTPLLPGTVMS